MPPLPPQVPRPGSRRGLSHAIQRRDDQAGRFVERFFEFAFPAIPPNTSVTTSLQVMSLGSRFVRVLGLRGTILNTNRTITGLERAAMMLRLQVSAQEDFITSGDGQNQVSLASLSSGQPSPWFWFAAPPKLRAGDTIQATITNSPAVEAPPTLTPELTLRVCDDLLWRELYEREIRAALDAGDPRFDPPLPYDGPPPLEWWQEP